VTYPTDDAAREEHEREADARRRLEHIEQTHDSHTETATEDHPEVASAQVDRNGRQHDLTDSSSYLNRSRPRRGPAR